MRPVIEQNVQLLLEVAQFNGAPGLKFLLNQSQHNALHTQAHALTSQYCSTLQSHDPH